MRSLWRLCEISEWCAQLRVLSWSGGSSERVNARKLMSLCFAKINGIKNFIFVKKGRFFFISMLELDKVPGPAWMCHWWGLFSHWFASHNCFNKRDEIESEERERGRVFLQFRLNIVTPLHQAQPTLFNFLITLHQVEVTFPNQQQIGWSHERNITWAVKVHLNTIPSSLLWEEVLSSLQLYINQKENRVVVWVVSSSLEKCSSLLDTCLRQMARKSWKASVVWLSVLCHLFENEN